MPRWALLLWKDILDAVLDLRPMDFAQPSFFALWLVILFMPLIGVDRRDPISGIVFVLFCMASGAALVFALPQELIPESDLKTINITLTCMGLGAGIRWVFGAQRKKDIIKEGN